MKTLQVGSRGEDVRWLQYVYIDVYKLDLKADGDFGTITKTATQTVQRQLGLDPDGRVGPLTQKALGLSDFKMFLYPREYYDIWFAGKPYDGNTPNPVKTLKQWAKEEKADFTHNLAFFVMDDKGVTKDQFGYVKGRTLQDVRGKGKDIGYGTKTQERVVIDSNNFCCGWTVAIKDGKLVKKKGGAVSALNANGFLKDGTYFQVQSLTTATEYEMAKWIYDNYAVDLMLMQDGGGSVGFYDANLDILVAPAKGSLTNGRAVATAVCIKKKPGITEPPSTPKKKVCLDPGHGKEEAGKQSPDGTYREHEFNLDMAKRMGSILTAHGVEVTLTRTTDSQLASTGTPDLAARVKIANSIPNLNLFVSLHSNASAGSGWSDAKGYTAYTSVAGSAAERNKAANAIIESVKDAGITLRNPPLKHSLFYVLRYTIAPAVLLEQGFHTNKEEVELLKSDWYRQKLAILNCRGILKYLGIAYKGEIPAEDPLAILRAQVKVKYAFDETTMLYLDKYGYAKDLYQRLLDY